MLKPKKILFLITKSNWGGAQRYVYDLATSLPKDRFTAAVALGGDGPLKQKLAEAGIETIFISGLQRDISLKKELSSFFAIKKIVGQYKPDILHVNSSKAGGIGALVGRLLGVPKIIYSAHGWAFNENRSLLSRLVVGFFHWLTIMLSHVTIAVSNATKAQMKWPLAQRKIVVVHNGRPAVNFLDKTAARRELVSVEPRLTAQTEQLWTGTIAELHPIKQHHLMIKAVAKLVAEGTPLVHVIIGDGELKTELQSLIQDHKLENNVFLLGHIHEAARLLPAFDIFTLTSRSEALGYTVIEAAQAQLPIIATKVGGIPEIITDGWDGLLLDPKAADGLVTALRTLLADPDQREKMAKAALTRGRHFSLERMVVDTTSIYNR